MRKQIFISHSGKDRAIVDAIIRSFDGTGVVPLLMEDVQDEVLRDGQANWQWIRKQIQKSEALFVILSRGLIAREHTQNWVAFEIGVAAGSDPPKPVFVIMGEHVKFPVPYLNHYFPYSVTNMPMAFRGGSETLWTGNVERIMRMYIKNPKLSPRANLVVCGQCRTKFHIHGADSHFHCPCCSLLIQRPAIRRQRKNRIKEKRSVMSSGIAPSGSEVEQHKMHGQVQGRLQKHYGQASKLRRQSIAYHRQKGTS